MAFSAVALFCEDVREERSGAESLIGVMFDNVNLMEGTRAFAKLVIYVRMIVSSDEPPEEMRIALRQPNGEEAQIGLLEKEFVENSIIGAKEVGSPIVSLISRATAAPFLVPEAGRYLVLVRNDSAEIAAGTLNLQFAPTAAPPSFQSPTGSS